MCKLRFYEPEEELGENFHNHNCAYANSTGAIWTLTVFTQFLLGFIASRVTGFGQKGFFQVAGILYLWLISKTASPFSRSLYNYGEVQVTDFVFRRKSVTCICLQSVRCRMTSIIGKFDLMWMLPIRSYPPTMEMKTATDFNFRLQS